MSAGKPLTDSLILLDRVGNYPPDSVGNNSDLLIRMLAVEVEPFGHSESVPTGIRKIRVSQSQFIQLKGQRFRPTDYNVGFQQPFRFV